MDSSDKTHADWLLTSQECLVKNADPSLSTTIEHLSDGTQCLIIQQIPSDVMSQLSFITNTDQNNNYLYIEKINMYLNGCSTPVDVIGIENTLIKLYNVSDTNSFISYNNVHSPWRDESFIPFNVEPRVLYTLSGFINTQCRNLPRSVGINLNNASFAFDIVLKTSYIPT